MGMRLWVLVLVALSVMPVLGQQYSADKPVGTAAQAPPAFLKKAGIDQYGLTPHHTTRHSAMTCAGAKPEATLSGMMKQAGMDSPTHIASYLHSSLDAARAITRG